MRRSRAPLRRRSRISCRNLAKTSVTFPEGYQNTFKKYHTINFPATKQVRYYFANNAALAAAKDGKTLPNGSVLFAEVYSAKLGADGKPITGADGFFVPDQLLFYTAMARDAGWGKDIPEMLRNEDWNYAAFTTAKQLRPVNQAECLACHKPLDKVSYTFTLDQLPPSSNRQPQRRRVVKIDGQRASPTHTQEQETSSLRS